MWIVFYIWKHFWFNRVCRSICYKHTHRTSVRKILSYYFIFPKKIHCFCIFSCIAYLQRYCTSLLSLVLFFCRMLACMCMFVVPLFRQSLELKTKGKKNYENRKSDTGNRKQKQYSLYIYVYKIYFIRASRTTMCYLIHRSIMNKLY